MFYYLSQQFLTEVIELCKGGVSSVSILKSKCIVIGNLKPNSQPSSTVTGYLKPNNLEPNNFIQLPVILNQVV